MGDREGGSGVGGCEDSALSYAAGAVQLVLPERELEHRAAGYALAEGARSGVQPIGVTDCGLDRPPKSPFGCTDRCIELVPVGLAEHQDVDVPDWPPPGLPGVTCGPGAVDVGPVDTADRPE